MNTTSSLWILGIVLGVAVIAWGVVGTQPAAPIDDVAAVTTETEVASAESADADAGTLGENCIVIATPLKHLELLDPVYSEKAVFVDDRVMIAFHVPLTASGVAMSELAFQLENRSDEVIAVVWDRCSIQLPGADTVNIMHEEMSYDDRMTLTPPTSIAPGGLLLDTVVPVSEVCYSDEGWYVTSNILDNGPFLFVLALEVEDPCCPERQIEYHTFRFVIR
ncbi:hypothetical protein JW848_08120 [Candidatus Bipolaricaulota bacterium]|nr:hypothetical protein [Candidatus Bipolaricaulota bacterium]